MNYKTMSFDELMNWCFDNGKEDWLETMLASGKSFLQIKESFVAAFMPEIKPPKKPQPLTMAEKFALRRAGK